METLTRRGIPWTELEALQAELVGRVTRDPREAFLLVSEPTPTFTYGLSGTSAELLWADAEKRGVKVHPVARGGRWTYHGPGQIVIYPIGFLPKLGYPKRAVRKFLGDLASSVRLFLAGYGLKGDIRETPFGVFVGDEKIASFGLSLRNGVSSHGLAFYAKPQTGYFDGIIPCGMDRPRITSLEEAGVSLPWERVAGELTDYIKRGFQASKN